jgi:hypothetical protein
MCSPKVPKPDPQIGEAAKQNADIAASMRDIAKDQLAWERDRAAVQDPLVQRIVNQQISQGDTNQARADEQWNIYKNLFQPVEQRMVDDANNFDSQERKDRMAGQAAADVTQSYANTTDQNQRQMERMGVNPNSGRFAAINNEMNLNRAKDTAGAMNKTRTDTELQGLALRQGAAQFGRNMPNTGLAADAAALNGGNSAVGNMNASNAARNASMASAQNWFGGATNANNSAGGLGLGLYQGQLQRAQMQNNQFNDTLSGIGSLVGMGGMMFLRKGGMIKNYRPYRPRITRGRPPSLGRLRPRGYDEGGMIEGPGTGTSDSIPASIEGMQPIRVSNGEAVLNKEAVNLVGEDFIHRINAGGLAMLNGRREEMTEGAA